MRRHIVFIFQDLVNHVPVKFIGVGVFVNMEIIHVHGPRCFRTSFDHVTALPSRQRTPQIDSTEEHALVQGHPSAWKGVDWDPHVGLLVQQKVGSQALLVGDILQKKVAGIATVRQCLRDDGREGTGTSERSPRRR